MSNESKKRATDLCDELFENMQAMQALLEKRRISMQLNARKLITRKKNIVHGLN